MKYSIVLLTLFMTLIAASNAQTKIKLPFVGKKYFDDKAHSTTYVVTIKSDGSVSVIAGGPGISNHGWIIYKGKYKSVMKNKEEGIKIEGVFLYLLNKNGEVRIDCFDIDNENCPCKYNIKTTDLIN